MKGQIKTPILLQIVLTTAKMQDLQLNLKEKDTPCILKGDFSSRLFNRPKRFYVISARLSERPNEKSWVFPTLTLTSPIECLQGKVQVQQIINPSKFRVNSSIISTDSIIADTTIRNHWCRTK